MTLSWTAGLGATSYKIYYGSSPGNYTQSVTSTTTSKVIDVDLTTIKYFVVVSVNSWGESAKSNEVSAGIPQAPAGLTAKP